MYCKSCGLEVKIGESKCQNCGGKEFTDEKPFVESRLYKKAVMLMETRGGSNKTIILTKFLAWYSLFISFVIGTVFGSNDDFHYFALVYIILFLGSIATIRYSHLKRVSLIYSTYNILVYIPTIILVIIMTSQPGLLVLGLILMVISAIPLILTIFTFINALKDCKIKSLY